MQPVPTDQLRNIVVTGHSGTGKTMLCESFALSMGVINRLGSIEEGTTLSDYASDEIERKHSLNTSLIHGNWKDKKINIIDTPGLLDFHGDVKSAMRVADTVLITVNAATGVEVGTDTVWDYTQEYYKPTMFVLTKLDADRADFDMTIEALQDHFGHLVTPIQFPIEEGQNHHVLVDVLLMKQLEFDPDKPGSMEISDIPDLYRKKAEELHQQLVEAVAETDEELMNRFFDVGTLTEDELRAGIKSALVTRTFFPVFCTSPLHLIGSERLLNAIVNLCPSPIERGPEHAFCSVMNDEKLLDPDPEGPTVAFIFKTMSEPRVGEISYVRVYSGHIETGHELIDAQTGQLEKLGQVYTMEGQKKLPVDKLLAGDIGMVVKLKNSHTNDTLADKGVDCRISPIIFPEPVLSTAIVPTSQGDEEKISAGLHHLHEEDPSFTIEHDTEFNQTILKTLGETHLDIIISRLFNKFNVQGKPRRSAFPTVKRSGSQPLHRVNSRSSRADVASMAMCGSESNRPIGIPDSSSPAKWSAAWCLPATFQPSKKGCAKPSLTEFLPAIRLLTLKQWPMTARIIRLTARRTPSKSRQAWASKPRSRKPSR